MTLAVTDCPFGNDGRTRPEMAADPTVRHWYAVFVGPQTEKSVVRHLAVRQIESFLPTYESVREWKNRQRRTLVLPLFPTYLFARIDSRERVKVLQCPGVLQLVGNGRGPIPLADTEVDLLRCAPLRERSEPFRDLVVGEKVRIRRGPMQGVQGTLVRRRGALRFVLTLELINQHVAFEVDAEDLEAASC